MEIVFDKTKKVLLSLVLTLLFISISTTIFAANTFRLNIASATMYEGKEIQLTANGQGVTWTSSNPSKATVNNGKVKAIEKGTVTITAEKNGEKHSCEIKINKLSFIDKLRGVTMNATKVTLYEGEKLILKADGATKWSTTMKSVLSVNSGNIEAKKAGIAIVSAKAGSKTATCWVTVKKAEKMEEPTTPVVDVIEKLELEKDLILLGQGANTQLKANKKVKSWRSNNKAVATVDESTGKVTGVAQGAAIITATDESGKEDTCKITVFASKKEVKVGETIQFPLTDRYTSWSITEGKDYISYIGGGIVEGISAGSGVLTVERSDGQKITCKITVTDPYLYTNTDYQEVYNYKKGNYKYDTSSWAAFSKLTSNYTIAVKKEKLNSVIKTIVDKQILQSRGGNCHKIGIYHISLLVGARSENDATYEAAKTCGDRNKGQKSNLSEAEMLKQIKTWIDQGKPVLLHVTSKANTSSGQSEHWVTVVGYKTNECNSVDDLLILGPTFGTLQNIDGKFNETEFGIRGDRDIRIYN